MRSLMRVAVVGLFLAAVWPARGLGQATDPASGTWELNVRKSTYSPGPAPKSQTRTYESSGDGVKYTAKGVDAEGKPLLIQYAAKFDGKDYPLTGNPDSDMISLKRIDSSTVESTQKRSGKVVITSTRTVSRDGKVLTVKSKGTNARGEAINNVAVFDKRQ
jgi:hypothetical protein